uniref:Uncharacterized protein n=1 Tax=Streptomyces avermitilis TaxID=33903 RepID=A0A499V5P2_STRAX|nr:hypothetical protein SAVMC3_23520 [Streptomyces avermitilis]
MGSRQPLRLARREGLPGGVRGGRGARQCVRDRVQEGPHQRFRLGKPERSRARERDGMALVRKGGGDGPEVGDVLGVQRSGTPCVEAVRRQARQQPAAGHEPQGVQGGGAPAGGGGVGGGVTAGAGEQRQGRVERQGHRGHGASAHAGSVRSYDRELLVGQRGAGERWQRSARRIPERDPPLSRQRRGQEDGGQPHRHGRVDDHSRPHRDRAGGACRTPRNHPVPHTPGHLPPLRRISCLRLYGRGLTIGPGAWSPVIGRTRQGTARDTT